jgi:hypothetical protein
MPEIREYSKSRLAKIVGICRPTLVKDIDLNIDLKEKLIKSGYRKNQKLFRRQQTQILFDFYCIKYNHHSEINQTSNFF